jgi:methylmalonyl-CoA mutase
VKIARERQSLRISAELFKACDKSTADFSEMLTWKDGQLDPKARKLLDMWPATVEAYSGDEYVVKIRDKEIRTRWSANPCPAPKSARLSCPSLVMTAKPCAS